MRQHGIQLEYEEDEHPKPLNLNSCILLFRAVQELLINTVKHAQAKTAKLSFHRDNGHVRITVADDGIGYELITAISGNGNFEKFGLFSIRERLRALGGSFEVVSKLTQGTKTTLTLPLTEPNSSKTITSSLES
jgi:signal transduction histidine kinase